MHYNAIRDAGLITAITLAGNVFDQGPPAVRMMCYIAIFITLWAGLEKARDWEDEQKEKDPRDGHPQSQVHNKINTPSL